MGWLSWGGVNLLYELLAKAYAMGNSCYRLLIFRYLLLIAMGVYVNVFGFNIKRSIEISALFLSTVYIYIVSILQVDPIVINKVWAGTSYAVAPYLVPIISLFIIKGSGFKLSILEMIGKASYDIFLVQMVYFVTGVSFINRVLSNLYIRNTINIVICVIGGLMFYCVDSKLTGKITRNLVPKIDGFIDKIRIVCNQE